MILFESIAAILRMVANAFGIYTAAQKVAFAAQATWYVAPQTGSNTNDGATLLTALRTIEEVAKRRQGVLDSGTQQILIWVTEDDAADHAIRWTGAFPPETARPWVIYQGIAKAPLASGNVTAATPLVVATKQAITITDAAKAAAFWTPFVGKIVRFGSGAEAVVIKDLGAKTARLSQTQAGDYDGSPMVVVAGDTYDVLDLVQMTGDLSTEGECEIDFQDLRLGDGVNGHGFGIGAALCFLESCIVDGLDVTAGANCQAYNTFAIGTARAEEQGALLAVIGGAAAGYTARSLALLQLGRATLQGGALLADTNGSIEGSSDGAGLQYVAIYDSAAAVVLGQGGRIALGTIPLWGSGCTVIGCKAEGGSVLTYDPAAVPSIAGPATELSLGGISTSFAAVQASGGLVASNGALVGPTTGGVLGPGRGRYGDGSDLALVFDGVATVLGLVPVANVYTAVRDITAESVAIRAGVRLTMAGFELFSRSLAVDAGGFLSFNGADAVGRIGGVTTANGSLGLATGGGAGANLAIGGGGAAGGRTSAINAVGTGGKGGDAGAQVGGAGGAVSAISVNSGTVRTSDFVFHHGCCSGAGGTLQANGGAGGGGGAADNITGVGGGGGAGGRVLAIAAALVVNNGTIECNGGAGAAAPAAGTGGAGGGGGGRGGLVAIVSRSYSGSGVVRALGGAHGAGAGTGANGADGSNGDVLQFSE